ncbi:MAG: hypothetical protein AB7L90_08175 [Hyphomicrobiaceae bacterium]
MSKCRTVVLALTGLAIAMPPTLAADDVGYRAHTKAGKFENVRDDAKDAIIGRGFVIDHVGRLDDMLERTAEAIGNAAQSPYKNAVYFQFCPAKLTHEAVSATPFAIANCPIAIFVFEAAVEPGRIQVGYRLPVKTDVPAMRTVNEKLAALLDEIAAEATAK